MKHGRHHCHSNVDDLLNLFLKGMQKIKEQRAILRSKKRAHNNRMDPNKNGSKKEGTQQLYGSKKNGAYVN